jgi:uncharacterized protein YbaR (Trm112 family)
MFADSFITILRDPKLDEEGQNLVTQDRRTSFPILAGIPSFLKEGDVTGENAKYQKFHEADSMCVITFNKPK